MDRRTILNSAVMTSAATAAALALAACGTGIISTRTQLQTDAALATAGMAAVAASVLATPNLALDTAARIDSALATVNAANAAIQQATATVGTNAQTLVAAIKMAAPLMLAQLNPSSAEAIAINAALSLMPTILAAAGVTAASVTSLPMENPKQARLVLKGYTGRN